VVSTVAIVHLQVETIRAAEKLVTQSLELGRFVPRKHVLFECDEVTWLGAMRW
jgi:hypothetical protein